MANKSQAEMKARANELILRSVTRSSQSTSWYWGLTKEDRKYVSEVVLAYIANPDAQLQLVAMALKAELSIAISVSTIARTIREMTRDEKKTE